MAANVDLEVYRKTTKAYELRFTEKATGSPESLTGWTIYFTAKEFLTNTDNDAIIKYTITDHIDAVGGKTLIQLTQQDTDRVGSFYYDICYKDSSGNVGVLYQGRITFVEKATQRA